MMSESMEEKIKRILSEYFEDEWQVTAPLSEIMDLIPSDSDSGWVAQNETLRAAILTEVFPSALSRWMDKNADYRGQQMFLGMRAQFADINRKFWKLKSAMWDGQEMAFEKPDEIMEDMIGHLLMSIYFYRYGPSGKNIGE